MYVFDTCSFIAWHRESYPPHLFPDIEKLIIRDMENGIIIFPEDVKNEIKEQQSDLAELISNYRGYSVDDKNVFERNRENIVNKCPKLVKIGRKHNADPAVIALAQQVLGGIVVTQESTQKRTGMTACCERNGIKYLPLVGYFEERESELNAIRVGLFN